MLIGIHLKYLNVKNDDKLEHSFRNILERIISKLQTRLDTL